MARRAAPTTPRCLKTFMRTRPIFLMPKEMSSSFMDSKRCFCVSVKREYTRCWQISAVNLGKAVGTISPSMRSMGGAPIAMCRSEAFFSDIMRRSSAMSITVCEVCDGIGLGGIGLAGMGSLLEYAGFLGLKRRQSHHVQDILRGTAARQI